MKTIYVSYMLEGQIPVQVNDELLSDAEKVKDYVQDLIDEGKISDDVLISGIEQTDAWGIDGDAIKITLIIDKDNRKVWGDWGHEE